MKKEKFNIFKKYTYFQIVSVVLITILAIVIIVQIGIIIAKNSKIKDLKDKNDEITNQSILLRDDRTTFTFQNKIVNLKIVD